MAVRKIRTSWWVDFRTGQTRYRKRSPQNSRAGALAYEAALRQKLARGESIDNIEDEAQQKQTFEQFAWKWFEEYVIANNKHQEQRMKAYILRRHLIPFFGRMPLGQIGTQQAERYKARMLKTGLSRKTVNNHLAVFGKCVRTAYDWLRLSGIPPKVTLLKCPPPQTDSLSADECELLFRGAEGVIQEVVLTALRTGMRQGELRALQWSSIDWEHRIIAVRHSLNDRLKQLESPKSNRIRLIPMDIDVYEMLFKRKKRTGYVFLHEDGGPFDSQRLLRRLEKVRIKAALRHFTWHALRHTFGTQVADKSPLQAAQSLMGHSSITTTMRYVHVAPAALRHAIDLLNPKTAADAKFGQPVVNQWKSSQQQEVRQEILVPKNARIQAAE